MLYVALATKHRHVNASASFKYAIYSPNPCTARKATARRFAATSFDDIPAVGRRRRLRVGDSFFSVPPMLSPLGDKCIKHRTSPHTRTSLL